MPATDSAPPVARTTVPRRGSAAGDLRQRRGARGPRGPVPRLLAGARPASRAPVPRPRRAVLPWGHRVRRSELQPGRLLRAPPASAGTAHDLGASPPTGSRPLGTPTASTVVGAEPRPVPRPPGRRPRPPAGSSSSGTPRPTAADAPSRVARTSSAGARTTSPAESKRARLVLTAADTGSASATRSGPRPARRCRPPHRAVPTASRSGATDWSANELQPTATRTAARPTDRTPGRGRRRRERIDGTSAPAACGRHVAILSHWGNFVAADRGGPVDRADGRSRIPAPPGETGGVGVPGGAHERRVRRGADRALPRQPSPVAELDRSLGLWDGDRVVATSGIYSRDADRARRRRALRGHHLGHRGTDPPPARRPHRDHAPPARPSCTSSEREPVAALWAAEYPIYGRFGYAPATFRGGLTGRTERLRLRPDVDLGHRPGRPRPGRGVPGRRRRRCTTGCAASVPGNLARDDRWWDRLLRDEPEDRARARPSAALPAAHRARRHGHRLRRLPGEGRLDRARASPTATLTVERGAGRRRRRPTPRCGGSCSRSTWCAPCARPWPRPTTRCATCSTDARALHRTPIDALWVRLVDVDRALAARRYPAPIDLVLEVRDDVLPVERRPLAR